MQCSNQEVIIECRGGSSDVLALGYLFVCVFCRPPFFDGFRKYREGSWCFMLFYLHFSLTMYRHVDKLGWETYQKHQKKDYILRIDEKLWARVWPYLIYLFLILVRLGFREGYVPKDRREARKFCCFSVFANDAEYFQSISGSLGGGVKYFSCSSLLGKIQFD